MQTLGETIKDLIAAASQLEADAPSESELQKIVTRGAFRPAEDEAIGFWFARFLSARESLWAVIEEVLAILDKPVEAIEREDELRHFLLGYAAVCLLIRIDRLMLFRIGSHSIIQRKLNEPFPEYEIPRKQYTTIFSSFVDQKNVLAIRDAMRFRRSHRRQIAALASDVTVGFVVRQLDELESSLNASRLGHIKRAWSYVNHKWRRRGAVSAKNVLHAVMEGTGRTASEFYKKRNKRVSDDVFRSIAGFLLPGDVIVTRHAKALTNLFLPGFWPHAAFFVGTREQRNAANIHTDPESDFRWPDEYSVLEARKDGVLLRPLRETLTVDAFVVLRPSVSADLIRQAVERAFVHEGKEFNFDFDFFNSDRLVCTELIYRAYDGLGDLRIPLQDRAGRKTFSAEDLLDYSLDTQAFEPVAIFGVKDSESAVMFGADVRAALISSYKRPS